MTRYKLFIGQDADTQMNEYFSKIDPNHRINQILMVPKTTVGVAVLVMYSVEREG